MTHFYLDTEFNGFGGQLISLALISPDGPCFYRAIVYPHSIGFGLNPWVKENVIPKLGIGCLTPEDFRHVFHEFISQFDYPHIWCDWHADAVHFLSFLEGSDYGSSLDFGCHVHVIKTPPGQPISANPHNALADATALMNWHREQCIKDERYDILNDYA